MKEKIIGVVVFIFLIFFGCSKQKSDETIQNDIVFDDNVIISEDNNIETLEQNTSITIFPKIMYVNSKAGLRKRSEPSINGEITGLLLYGDRIIIWEKSNAVDVIDGIIDYWYRLQLHVDRNEWIFGGYISEYLPFDLPIILGRWDNKNNDIEALWFTPNFEYRHSYRTESSNGRWGNWELNENIITVNNLKYGMDFKGLEKETENIVLEIIDNNNIILILSDRIIELKRSSEFW